MLDLSSVARVKFRKMGTDAQLIDQHKALVYSIATALKKRLGTRAEFEDVGADGYRGVLEASQRYDSEKGASFTTFAYYRIRGAMLDGLRATGSHTTQIHQRITQAYAIDNVAEGVAATHAMEKKNNATLDTTVRTLSNALDQMATALLLTDCHGYEEDQKDPEEALSFGQQSELMTLACDQLPERQAKLIRAVYFENKSLVQASEEIGVSKSWASRIHATALQSLQSLMESSQGVTSDSGEPTGET